MGILHGKDKSSKVQDLDKSMSRSGDSDTNWVETIDRSFVVVWCDSSVGSDQNPDDDTHTLMELARIVNKKRQLVHAFNEVEACRNFIANVNNICLIVSGSMGLQLVPLVHSLGQIHSIYIFCLNKPKYDEWAKQYDKILGVFTDIKEICECLKKYFISQSSSIYEQIQFDLVHKDLSLPTTDKREVSFLYPILCRIILLNMNAAKQQSMIDYCRMEYNNEYQVQLIDEFEKTYSQHDPIWWFTRECFFQKIINQALQTHDLYTLCAINPFIKDLDNKLVQLHKKQGNSSSGVLQLYSSQSILTDDFNKLKLNKGGLICVNEFLTANTEKVIGLMFIEHQNTTTEQSNYINVLFEITISQTTEANVPYANIGSASPFVHEKEYLISMSSVYRIDKVVHLAEIQTAWIVHMTLVDKNDSQLNSLTQLINIEQLDQKKDLSQLGTNITHQLYQFKSTRKLFEQALNFKIKQIRSILIHYNMGIIYDGLNEYDKSLDEYNFAKSLIRSSVLNGHQKDNLCLIPFYSNIGLTYQHMNISSHAFDHAFRALDILSKDHGNSIFKKELSASSHFILGLILELQGKSAEAAVYYEQALKSRREYLPNDHPDITNLQNTITSLSSQEVML